MSNKIKIINILHHNPNPVILKMKDPVYYLKNHGPMEFEKLNSFPFWVGFFLDDHHIKFARELQLRSDNIEIECWRPYFKINEPHQKKINNILHKIFPSKEYHLPIIGKFLRSISLLQHLKKEINQNKIIIHLHDGHSRFSRWLILKLKKENIPIVYQQRSSNFSKVKLNNCSFRGKIRNIFWYYDAYFENQSLQRIDYYFSSSKSEADFLINKLKYNKSEYLKNGIDYNFYKPSKNKKDLRIELQLPLDKIILVYIGKFSYPVELDKVIKIVNNIKLKNDNLEFLVIGGYKNDEFYDLCIKEGCIVKERVTTEEILKYYQASDINIYPMFSEEIIDASGFGTANIEALACGLPMLSNNIKHFPGNNEELEKIGMTMKNEKELEANLNFMIDNLQNFKNCRKISQKYFDIETTINKFKKKYTELANYYYSENNEIF